MSLSPVTSPIAAIALIDVKCPARERSGMPAAFASAGSNAQSKTRAILGGEMSALERIKAQQNDAIEPHEAVLANAGVVPKMEPAASGTRIAAVDCFPKLSANNRSEAFFPAAPKNTDFLASKRVLITKTAFDRDWARVRNESLGINAMATFGQRSVAGIETIQSVNRWVNKSVSYIEDRELFGVADYWAGARMTLMLKRGDCEDIALTKMQILAELGIDRKNMYLTIARDTVRRADHALLIVKIEDRFVVLDNATDQVLDGAASHGYNPVFSFANEQSWIHGY